MADFNNINSTWGNVWRTRRLPGNYILSRFGGRMEEYLGGGPASNSNPFPHDDMIYNGTGNGTFSYKDVSYTRKAALPSDAEYYPIGRYMHGGRIKKYANGGYAEAINDTAPYLSNIANLTRRLPSPPTPYFESITRAPRVNLSGSRANINKQVRSGERAAELFGGRNSGVTAANTAAMIGKGIEGTNSVNEKEAELNANYEAQNNWVNSQVGARNTNRANDYLTSLFDKNKIQQQLQYENLANFGDKFQAQERDHAQIALEKRKLDLLPELYKGTGVWDRHLTPYGEAEQNSLPTHQFGGNTLGSDSDNNTDLFRNGGGIHIKPSHRGRFTAWKKRTGESTEEALHSSNPRVRKMAVFARNARSWSH